MPINSLSVCRSEMVVKRLIWGIQFAWWPARHIESANQYTVLSIIYFAAIKVVGDAAHIRTCRSNFIWPVSASAIVLCESSHIGWRARSLPPTHQVAVRVDTRQDPTSHLQASETGGPPKTSHGSRPPFTAVDAIRRRKRTGSRSATHVARWDNACSRFPGGWSS